MGFKEFPRPLQTLNGGNKGDTINEKTYLHMDQQLQKHF